MTDLAQQLYGSPAVIVGSSPPQDLDVSQAEQGKEAVAPEPDQHLIAFFKQGHGFVEVTGGRCAQCEVEGDRPDDGVVHVCPVAPVGAERCCGPGPQAGVIEVEGDPG